MVRRQIPSPAIAWANASGSSRLRLYASQRAGAQTSAWSREPRTSASLSRPAYARRPCGTRTRPCASSSVSIAPANSCRCSSRALASVIGRLPTRFESSVQAGHRKDREAAVDPPRDHGAVGELPAEPRGDGDAPLAVNRVSVLTGEHRSRSLLTSDGVGWSDQPGFRYRPPGTGPACGNFPTFHHFAPLPGILARRGGPSMGKSQRGRAGGWHRRQARDSRRACGSTPAGRRCADERPPRE